MAALLWTNSIGKSEIICRFRRGERLTGVGYLDVGHSFFSSGVQALAAELTSWGRIAAWAEIGSTAFLQDWANYLSLGLMARMNWAFALTMGASTAGRMRSFVTALALPPCSRRATCFTSLPAPVKSPKAVSPALHFLAKGNSQATDAAGRRYCLVLRVIVGTDTPMSLASCVCKARPLRPGRHP